MDTFPEIKIISPFENDDWINYISNKPDATIFHHPQWLSVLAKQYKYKTFVVCLFDKERVIAGIPFCEVKTFSGKRKWVSLPFTDYCPPLYNKKEDLVYILKSLKGLKDVSNIEIRDNIKEPGYFPIITHFIHVLDINKTYEEVISGFHKSQIIRNLQKAEKNKLTIEKRYDGDALGIFYKLHIATRKKQGVPVQPKRFFYQIYNEIIRNNQGFVVIVKKEEEPLAAALFLYFNQELVYKFGASDPKYLHLRPNHLLFDFAIKEGMNMGCTSFNFGKTDLDHESLRDFKKYWGAGESELIFSYFPVYKSSKLISFVNKSIISPIIKKSPKFVSRVIGELFYKFMG